jgi:phosphopantothenoylcysteine decarboxylase/phosphopantothenate--cysteine ligase
MNLLAGKHIVLGLSGGVACYKAAELVRLLTRAQATVQVVMTEAAQQFITPVTLQALSGRPVYGSQWDARPDNNMAHINLSRQADAVLIAPCSADFIARLAQGRCDELLSLLCLARPAERVPLLLAPAMNREMWAHPATQRNLAQVVQDGAVNLGVGCGEQACGETGDGRMLEAEEIAEELAAFFSPKLLAGQRLLITAGPTFEAIDPVRGITNLSSGKMGFAIARAARAAGAQVTLVAGPVHLPTPRGVRRINVVSARNMLEAVEGQWDTASIFIATAAVAGARGAVPTRPGRGAVLRRLCRRERKPAAACPGQARAQGRAAAGRQHRPGHFRPGRQRSAAGRCPGPPRTAARQQADTGAAAGR